jgi:aryl-alcohol dehydrogenase-like predicted oxidoreductase
LAVSIEVIAMSLKVPSNLSRRSFIERGAIAGAAISLGGSYAWAADTASLPLITRKIPKSGEALPVIGLGTNAYGVSGPEELAARREVLQKFPVLGAKIIDTARVYGDSELVLGRFIKELGIRDQIFLATKTPAMGAIAPGDGELQAALQRLQTDKIDLLQAHNLYEVDTLLPRMQEWKRAGKVRYIGVSTSVDTQYPQMKNALNTLPLDFIQVDYSIDNRGAADEILPLAQDKGVAVLINVPLGGRRGNVLSRLSGKPLPPWAAEIDATSWAQVLLKYNISHPAVTAVIPGMTKLAHLEDNQRAGRGRLPDAALRKKIEEFWATV